MFVIASSHATPSALISILWASMLWASILCTFCVKLYFVTCAALLYYLCCTAMAQALNIS